MWAQVFQFFTYVRSSRLGVRVIRWIAHLMQCKSFFFGKSRYSVVYNSILSSSLLFSHNLELWEEDDKKDDDVESNNSSQKDILASSNKPVFWQRGETWMFKYSWHTTKKKPYWFAKNSFFLVRRGRIDFVMDISCSMAAKKNLYSALKLDVSKVLK